MLYDVYEISLDGEILERIYQPSEPMYDSTALFEAIRMRIKTQRGEGEVTFKNLGQVENVGGVPPSIL